MTGVKIFLGSQIAALAKNPEKIHRVGKSRRTPCKGGCGRWVWTDYCRKCERKMVQAARKAQKRKS